MANLGEMSVNVRYLSNNVIAGDKVLYKGHAVAAVAATSAHIAEEALGLIEVEYEVLHPVLHVLDAMREEAPLLHEAMTTTELGQKTDKHSNIANHFRFALGDVAQGFRDAEVVIECSPTNLSTGEPGTAHIISAMRTGKNVISVNKGPLALAFPSVPIVIPHFGAGLLREALMVADLCPNIFFDTSSSNGWIKYSPGLSLTDVLRQALAVLGTTRYLFQFAPPATGTVQLAWAPAHGIADLATSPNAFAAPRTSGP